MATMLLMATQIETYQEMCALSAQMVTAAQSQDWDALVDLEKKVSRLRDVLMTVDDASAVLPPAEIERKRQLIQQILEDDAEVRRHTEPWMEQVRQFLGGTAKRQQVARAYGADR